MAEDHTTTQEATLEAAHTTTEGQTPGHTPIIGVPVVARRIERRTTYQKITSNGTIAAAVMVLAAILAIIVANSDAYEAVHHFLETEVGFSIGAFSASLSFEEFVNDFLMAIFFLLVGIELKYEMTVGQLRKPRQAALPMLAAVGGVVVPSLIYLLVNWGGAVHGWAVPMATDIAFALGVMSLLGKHVAPATKVFFSTLAIADDILAIIVIAVFYGQSPSIPWLGMSAVMVIILAMLGRAHVYQSKPYLLVGLILWVCMFNSGIHATLAGVILALFLPARSDIRLGSLRRWLGERARHLDDVYDEDSHVLGQHDFTEEAARVERVMHHVTPPLQRVENTISVPVNFIILPLFAFVNAQVRLVGVDIGSILADHVTQGVFLGAFLGKPLGIILVTVLLVKIGFAKLPRGVDWVQVIGVGIMGGLGFTMSILIAGLAFTDPNEILAAKCAILAGSVVSGLVGALFIVGAGKVRERRAESTSLPGGRKRP
ncbi:MAG: Na+/H+ antiporter NhaA [Atopobiaceae bacterium]|nr:Na+/H+ antiporter NhaA [Atopobiaceae bacterium]MCI2174162.1 Na+/H+ antiporter NhaA [Atopobiaceae bacterium]MCI2206803.1 Na+/H+ antiporter NhaA [Atopobiaceae bacterium]